jgi:DNA repair exonuclease SbcCD ATPase subunit
MKTRAQVLLIAVVALGAAAAGCGGGGGGDSRLSKSQYENKLNGEGNQLSAAFSAVQLDANANVDELTKKLTNLETELDRSATRLENLQPPENAKADNQKIADILHRIADKLGELKSAVKAKDRQKVQQLGQEVFAILSEGQTAAKDLQKKGYDVGKLGNG